MDVLRWMLVDVLGVDVDGCVEVDVNGCVGLDVD